MHHIKSFHQRHKHSLRLLLRFFTYLAAFFLLTLAYWVRTNFGEPSLEQVLYHVQFGMEGLVDTDTALIKSFAKICLALPIAVSLLLVGIEAVIGLYLSHGAHHHAITKMVSSANSHLLKVIYWTVGHRAPIYVLIVAATYFGTQFSILAFVQHQFGKDYFSENYIYPANVTIKARQPKNLVLIYVESMESSYRDASLFGKNLLASMDALGGASFARYRQAPGTGWTIAGMTATQCGLPLKSVSLYDGNDQGQNIKTFLPKAICLGDVLHDFGFYNVYMGGDALSFSGKGRFYLDHHYDEVYGRDELKGSLSKDEMNYWGLYDDDLLTKVKAKLITLHANKRPFNLTLSTIDTHGPDGYFSKRCQQLNAKNFSDIVQCTSTQVSELVQFMKKSGYLRDTNVVILGDHLVMYNPLSDKIDKLPERFVYNSFISQKSIKKNREDVLHFDMYPTMLEFIGFQVTGGRLGLGYTAITKDAPQPPANEYEDMNADLLNQSEQYLELWKPNSSQ